MRSARPHGLPSVAPSPPPQVRRFAKYRLGEGLEKKSNDFAAEVAQQTQAKAPAAPKPKEDKPKAEEPKKVRPARQGGAAAGRA